MLLTLSRFETKHPVYVNFREVVLGEHTVGTDPDCPKCENKITRGIDKIFIHEDFNGIDSKNDIAIIKLDDSVPLFKDYQAQYID